MTYRQDWLQHKDRSAIKALISNNAQYTTREFGSGLNAAPSVFGAKTTHHGCPGSLIFDLLGFIDHGRASNFDATASLHEMANYESQR